MLTRGAMQQVIAAMQAKQVYIGACGGMAHAVAITVGTERTCKPVRRRSPR